MAKNELGIFFWDTMYIWLLSIVSWLSDLQILFIPVGSYQIILIQEGGDLLFLLGPERILIISINTKFEAYYFRRILTVFVRPYWPFWLLDLTTSNCTEN